ncbi:MAG: alpha-L-rhamnosidase N-terminal domain-containing protein [Blautia obeum]
MEKRIKKARLYICGLGLYEAYVNGKKAGNEYLAPFLNDYEACYQYQTLRCSPGF